jgi:hypothetical protein
VPQPVAEKLVGLEVIVRQTKLPPSMLVYKLAHVTAGARGAKEVKVLLNVIVSRQLE